MPLHGPGRPLLLLVAGAFAVLAAGACDARVGGDNVQVGNDHVVQGSGTAKTESRDVHGFDHVSLGGTGTLVITQGASEGLKVTADDNVLPQLRSDVGGGRLQLGPRGGTSIVSKTPIRYDLAVKQLRSIEVTGAGGVQAASLGSDQLDLLVSGSGNVGVDRLTAGSLTVTVSGSGTLTLAGRVSQQTVTLSGAGSYEAPGLASKQATVTIDGAASSALRVSDSLDVTIRGTGDVTYIGSPSVTQHLSGIGSVRQVG